MTFIVKAEVSVPKVRVEKPEDHSTGMTTTQKPGGQAGQIEVEALMHEDQGLRPSDATLVAPSSEQCPQLLLMSLWILGALGQADKAFVPLLEEVCSWYPSLIECQRKRSTMFTQWAFTALGRVLHFLKTTKGKDMTEDACEHLQVLWEELETFKFDLSWLEPHVQSALGMKTYLEKAEQVKKLQENVAVLEIEVKMLKAKLAVAEVDAEVARRDLAKAEECFEERDMNTELGYGRP
ncbi:Ubiquitin carboxyl-terminal hydrolase family protein [Quillaja saponaria]|uniref:Ubiquitin carboxyl-terminal hydrolase family protein n=1 Tax=Quillaja saponaria TaxID=32244 RepID=A0AAD7PY78_QUISA|nr:Ubiquitin carboxyl-terminal hydrolase family protein [Quillaja saponaria]KAJ7971376.1 Ubiquitin carboxyl-terminal hydrolase family protein [Quillaja saponaria]